MKVQLQILAIIPLVLTACGANYDPPSLIVENKVRVLGIHAEPPAIEVPVETTLTLLAAGTPSDVTLCYAWAYCPFTWSKDDDFRCIDDALLVPLGTDVSSAVGIADVFASISHAQEVFARLGLNPPGTTSAADDPCQKSTGGAGNPFAGTAIPDSYILFQVAEANQFGGTCPDVKTALATACADRQKCLQGFKRLAVFPAPPQACTPFDASKDRDCAKADACDTHAVCGCDGRTYATDCARVAAKVAKQLDTACPNQNPDLTGIGLYWPVQGGTLASLGTLQTDTGVYKLDPAVSGVVNWPQDVTIVLNPGDTIELLPEWPTTAKEYVGKSTDPAAGPVYETLLFSWFTTAGVWNKDRSYDAYPENLFVAPGLAADGKDQDVTLWLVARDGRNGTTWLERHVTVQNVGTKGPDARHPLCRTSPPMAGCPAP